MKRQIIVNIPMTINLSKIRYANEGNYLRSSERAVAFPVNAFLEQNILQGDTITCILIAKHSIYSKSDNNIKLFMEELEEINQKIGATINYTIIDSEFAEERSVHEKLMSEIVEHIEYGSHIVIDITYGPKDLPIVEFSTLNFAERFLGCQIDHILYGQGLFNEDNELEEGKLCDLSPLYSLNSLTNTLSCSDPYKARTLLKTIIAI